MTTPRAIQSFGVSLIAILVLTYIALPATAYPRAPAVPAYTNEDLDQSPEAFTQTLPQQYHGRTQQQILLQQLSQDQSPPNHKGDEDYMIRDDIPPPFGTKPSDGNDWRVKCSQRCDERLMDVTGVGVQAIKTDWAEVRATVEYRRNVKNATIYQEAPTTPEEDKLLAELISHVQQELSKRAASVVEYLQKDKLVAPRITKLRTSTLTLEPIYEYINNRMVLSGYRATNSITFRVEIPYAGSVVDEIVQRGITRIDGISFVASPKELNKARHTAIAAAVEDAMGQALSAISGLGRVLPTSQSDIQIIRMDVVGVSRPEATNQMENSAMHFRGAAAPMMSKAFAADSVSSPVEGDEKTVTATVALKVRF